MIRPKRNDEPIQLTKQDLMKLLTEDDAMKHLLQKLLQEVLEAEMETALQASKSERTGGRLGYRSVRLPPIGGQGERQSLKGTQYYAKDQTCLQ